MMLCQECRTNEANIHIIKSVDGKQTEEFLCEQCARQKEELDFSFEPQFSLHKLFTSMLDQGVLGSRETMLSAKTQCPACGLSFAQFSQIGRLGCGECFTAFEKSLKPILRRIHASSLHTGKMPVRARHRVKYLRELDQLKEQLRIKVQNEEFEEAARLRDRIQAMKSDLQNDEMHENKMQLGEPKELTEEDDPEKGDQD